MSWDESKKAEMNLAGRVAAFELDALLKNPEATAQDIADWQKKYYRTAGHRRLGRLLCARSSEIAYSDISSLPDPESF